MRKGQMSVLLSQKLDNGERSCLLDEFRNLRANLFLLRVQSLMDIHAVIMSSIPVQLSWLVFARNQPSNSTSPLLPFSIPPLRDNRRQQATTRRMAGPPSTLRTAPHNDPSHQSLDEQVSPSLQQLIRLQIFTPLCLLVALGCNLVTVFAFHPNVGEINDDFETIWTAKKELVGGYLLLVSERVSRLIALPYAFLQMYVLQICYCLVITLAKSPATRELVVNGVGLRFVSSLMYRQVEQR